MEPFKIEVIRFFNKPQSANQHINQSSNPSCKEFATLCSLKKSNTPPRPLRLCLPLRENLNTPSRKIKTPKPTQSSNTQSKEFAPLLPQKIQHTSAFSAPLFTSA
jgi:hypothetical protein